MDVAALVKTNLEHYHLWNEVEVRHLRSGSSLLYALVGKANGSETLQWVFPVDSAGTLQPSQFASWFAAIELLVLVRPQKVVVAIVGDDSTVVYYNIHDGIAAPQN